MGLILMLLGLSIVLTTAQVVAIVYMWRESTAGEPPTLPHTAPAPPPQFFIAAAPGAPAHRDARVDRLLRQLEQHIRLEQAAAESYHLAPTADALHRHTDSPLVLH
ncbi:hypothetical protein TBR22_A01890 [Luteitalea sp. TBR-22]|uniref:hypothetical protein n=1 Tax=Luteitalea sp. TBR-22 TaxID=2802971 RepID=UPI001AF40477|nr:hypothetical protein [Luteitalea sp. TBR-22]BCS30990.1 hypothetical protein TBR22_A01890 [Luteitalea sp. TBR-22]